MEIKIRKNDYGYSVADCPFCDYTAHVREITKISPDPLRDLKRHITNQAKNEALVWIIGGCSGGIEKFKHLDYYKKHTCEKKIVLADKRQYDDDLKIK